MAVELREERRVTFLAADRVGSTALGGQLDPEEARLVVGKAVARMVRAVEELGGTAKDLAGDGIFALVGAPTPTRTTPSGPSGRVFASPTRSPRTRRMSSAAGGSAASPCGSA